MNAFTRQAFWFEVPYWDELPVIGHIPLLEKINISLHVLLSISHYCCLSL